MLGGDEKDGELPDGDSQTVGSRIIASGDGNSKQPYRRARQAGVAILPLRRLAAPRIAGQAGNGLTHERSLSGGPAPGLDDGPAHTIRLTRRSFGSII